METDDGFEYASGTRHLRGVIVSTHWISISSLMSDFVDQTGKRVSKCGNDKTLWGTRLGARTEATCDTINYKAFWEKCKIKNSRLLKPVF
jgi:hypothetical protein